MKRYLILPALLLGIAAVAQADEIRLKDGSKIIGTIVDFESDSFKIQTAYGFAMVRKDSIAQIIPAEPVRSSEPVKTEAAPTPVKAVTPPQAASSPARASSAPSPVPAPPVRPALAGATLAMPRPTPRPPQPAPVSTVEPAPTPAATASALAAPPAPAPAAPLGPPPIRESVQGNVYWNESYSFQLYRPPGWDVIPEARKALSNAITAMGTGDRTTLFVVGRENMRDSLEAQAAASERTLQKVYENYRHVSSAKRTIGGLPAVEWRFRGLADGHDWSVTALTIARGSDVFTLLGMTYADSDLIMQIRENVIAKMIASLQFSTR